VVGPGIAEALVATAVGLLAAIPATIAYNTFAARIDAILTMLDRFTSQFEEDIARLVEMHGPETVVAGESAATEGRSGGRSMPEGRGSRHVADRAARAD